MTNRLPARPHRGTEEAPGPLQFSASSRILKYHLGRWGLIADAVLPGGLGCSTGTSRGHSR